MVFRKKRTEVLKSYIRSYNLDFSLPFSRGGTMKTEFFNTQKITTLEELRTEFRKLALKLHPDKPTGNATAFKAMLAEYEKLSTYYVAQNPESEPYKKYSREHEKELTDAIIRLATIPGIYFEIIGTWLWVDATDIYRDGRIEELKAVFTDLSGESGNVWRYSHAKKRWHWSPYRSNAYRRGMYSLDKIREKFGSEEVKNTTKRKAIA